MSWSIKGTPYNPLSSFNTGGVIANVGVYYGMPGQGAFANCIVPNAGIPEFEEFKVRFVGVPGTGTRRSAFSRLRIVGDLVVVNTLGASGAVIKALLSDSALMALQRYTIVMPKGDSYDGCKCEGLRGDPIEETIGNGYIGTILPLVFYQYSTTN